MTIICKSSLSNFIALIIGLITISSLYDCSTKPCNSIRHLYNTLWSPDGSIIAEVEQNYSTNCDDAIPPPQHLIFMSSLNGSVTTSNINACWNSQYHFTADSKNVCTLFENSQTGIRFFKLDGTQLGSISDSTEYSLKCSFAQNGSSMLIAQGKYVGSILHLLFVLRSIQSEPWIGTSKIIFDTTNINYIRSIVWINPSRFAVRFIGGTIAIMDTSGTITDKFILKESNQTDTYYKPELRLVYQRTLNRIYAKDDEGLKMIELNTKQLKKIIDGNVVDFDVAGNGKFLAFQTTSDDIWISDADGDPKYRILPHSHEPRFSPDGNKLAAVYLKSSDYDELVIKDVH